MEENFMSTFQHIWLEFWNLLNYDLDFPSPIGDMAPIDLIMFFAVAYLLADVVSLISSRRD